MGIQKANSTSIFLPIQGVCLVWNLKYKRETPEYVFTSESPLVTARYQQETFEFYLLTK